MSQSDSEQQLRIWKDLAINKQMIMNEAASALKLKPEWTQDELKDALANAITRANDADDRIASANSVAEEQLAEMSARVKKTEKSLQESEQRAEQAQLARETAENQLNQGRKDNSDALQRAKKQVEEKQKELKAINTALADTPDNVVKKLKNLKRQKLEEATARNKAEDANRKLKKENKELKESNEELESLRDDSVALLAKFRELRDVAESAMQKLSAEDSEELKMPEVDHELLSRIDALNEDEEVPAAESA